MNHSRALNVLWFLVLLIVYVQVQKTSADLEASLHRCCMAGTNLSYIQQRCEGAQVPFHDIPEEYLTMCTSTVEICCLQSHRLQFCEEGKNIAKSGGECRFLPVIGGELHKDCCEGCRLGLQAARISAPCLFNDFSFGTPLDETFYECCNEESQIFEGSTDTTTHGSRCDKNICSQTCIDTGTSVKCECLPGYKLADDLRTCVDIDECSLNPGICSSQNEVCRNTVGSFKCLPLHMTQCPAGFKYNDAIGNCIDVDECSEGIDNCDRETELCLNRYGYYECQPKFNKQCPAGYRWSDIRAACDDINECEDNPCDQRTQLCVNAVGSFTCVLNPDSTECPTGYRRNTVTKICEDINECQIGIHTCASASRCDNTLGSFTCVRISGCGTGYTLNAATSTCEDDDECLLGSHNCGPGFVCRNMQGSFRCDRDVCPIGQRRKPDGSCEAVICSRGTRADDTGTCVDVDECLNNSTACPEGFRCENTVGSFSCVRLPVCSTGHSLNPRTQQCEDIDECTTGRHECIPPQTCHNFPSGYTCKCPSGYYMNSNSHCEDLDECARFRGQVCSFNSECRNTPGSYLCDCKEGFKRIGDTNSCDDIDECSEQVNLCQHNCINVWGSFQCTCNQGYEVGTDKRTCIDIDECELFRNSGSLCIGSCLNMPGSYKCECPEGYTIGSDKRTCQDIDECNRGDVCNGENEICLNTRGGYKCNSLDCPPGYERDLGHKSRCKRQKLNCDRQDTECYNQPISYSYNYFPLPNKLRIPSSGHLDFFTMRGPRFSFSEVKFQLNVTHASAPESIEQAERSYFLLRRTGFNEAMLSLLKPLEGPQEIQLELKMLIYQHGLLGGSAVAKIFIFVSQYDF